MFFEGDRIVAMREMILAEDQDGRQKALAKLLPLQRDDFLGIFKALKGRPATIRLLDPPLHEFLPHDKAGQQEMADHLGVTVRKIKQTVDALHEFNPMLGHRGCRLGIIYPEITRMQARAIFEAAWQVKGARPEIMVPLVGHVKELANQKQVILEALEEVKAEKKARKVPFEFKIGTMIEVPRGALTADEIATEAEFFSFGTNDLTQMGCGFSRDDAAKFLRPYVEEYGIYDADPFQSLDTAGVGQLVRIAVDKGRKARPGLKIGICGEHGGDPASIAFCHEVGLDYVSCSPYRVPSATRSAWTTCRARRTACRSPAWPPPRPPSRMATRRRRRAARSPPRRAPRNPARSGRVGACTHALFRYAPAAPWVRSGRVGACTHALFRYAPAAPWVRSLSRASRRATRNRRNNPPALIRKVPGTCKAFKGAWHLRLSRAVALSGTARFVRRVFRNAVILRPRLRGRRISP